MASTTSSAKDPLPIFTSSQMQFLLSRVTGCDVKKINSPKKVSYEPPTYKLLTDSQLAEFQELAIVKAKSKLRMPPVMKARLPIDKVLANDTEIAGLHESKFAILDISYGVSNRKRKIAIRETDGTLRFASWEERDRLNQVYNPDEGRQFIAPAMFEPDNLEVLLSKGSYIYVLDRACVQFEPDDPKYIQVCQRTYEMINNQRHFETLRSTRHFGPLVFHLAWYKKLGNLLTDCLEKNLLSDAIDIVSIHHIIHSGSPLTEDSKSHLEHIQIFADAELPNHGELQLLIQKLSDVNSQSFSSHA